MLKLLLLEYKTSSFIYKLHFLTFRYISQSISPSKSPSSLPSLSSSSSNLAKSILKCRSAEEVLRMLDTSKDLRRFSEVIHVLTGAQKYKLARCLIKCLTEVLMRQMSIQNGQMSIQNSQMSIPNGQMSLQNGQMSLQNGQMSIQNGQMSMVHHSWSPAGNLSSNEVKMTKLDRREEASLKFRRKRNQRCFDKKIRYANRKRLAERRPRVRGQFVRKMNGVNVDLNERCKCWFKWAA